VGLNTKQQELLRRLRTMFPQETIDITKNKHGNDCCLIVSRKFDKYLVALKRDDDRAEDIRAYLLDQGFDPEYVRRTVFILISPEEIYFSEK